MHHPSLSYWVRLNRFCYKRSVYEDNAEDPDTYDRYVFHRSRQALRSVKESGEIKDFNNVFLCKNPNPNQGPEEFERESCPSCL